jgi:hypothetical protein
MDKSYMKNALLLPRLCSPIREKVGKELVNKVRLFPLGERLKKLIAANPHFSLVLYPLPYAYGKKHAQMLPTVD